MNQSPQAFANARTRIRWEAFAASSALFPEVALPLGSYVAYGYLTADMPLIAALLLPCAALALLVSIHEARPLWDLGPRQHALIMVGLTSFGFLFAMGAAVSLWSGNASCYECGFAWFFMIAFPALLLEFAAGVIWLLLLWERRAEGRRHFRGPLPGIR